MKLKLLHFQLLSFLFAWFTVFIANIFVNDVVLERIGQILKITKSYMTITWPLYDITITWPLYDVIFY